VDERETFDALHSFASIARELAGQDSMSNTTQRIVDLAVKVLGCDAAVLTRLAGSKLVFEAGSDPALTQIVDQIAASTGNSLSLQACRQGITVVCEDLVDEPRWAEATMRSLNETAIRSALAFHLQLEERDLGALTFYSETPYYFTPAMRDLGGVYADHAAIALSFAQEHEQVANLTTALTTNREIGTAVGIVMNRFSLGASDAFDLLRITSQHANRKLHDIARDIVSSGDVGPIASAARNTASVSAGRGGTTPKEGLTN
jgi:GAF domain-containing protein